jgi:hypothetical protein
MSGTVALITVGELISSLGIDPTTSSGHTNLGVLLAANTMIPSFFAALCFYRAGTYYVP